MLAAGVVINHVADIGDQVKAVLGELGDTPTLVLPSAATPVWLAHLLTLANL
jgi:hypothetical protein